MSIYLNGNLIAGVGRHTESNAHTLLDFKWCDHIINSMEWLRSDTFSWQSGDVYSAVYNHLSADITGKSLQSETISGITIQYYLADDGHKIAPASEETNVNNLFNTTGVAWYYILDTVNERFKLPRSIAITEKNTTIDYENPISVSSGATSSVYGWFCVSGHSYSGQPTVQLNGATVYWGGNSGSERLSADCILWVKPGDVVGWTHFNGQLSMAKIYPVKKTDVSPDAQHKHLYFYVGQYTQSAIAQTAGITSEELNNKQDKLTGVSGGGDYVVEWKTPTSADPTWYRVYKSGWVEQGGIVDSSGTVTIPVEMADTNYQILSNINRKNSDLSSNAVFSLVVWNLTTTSFVCKKTYNNGSEAGDAGESFWYEVKGMAA